MNVFGEGYKICWIEVRRAGEGLLLIGNSDKTPPQRVETRRVERRGVEKQTPHSKPPKPRGLVGFKVMFFVFL